MMIVWQDARGERQTSERCHKLEHLTTHVFHDGLPFYCKTHSQITVNTMFRLPKLNYSRI